MTEERRNLRDFVFHGLLFESEAEVFRRAGINVGIDLGEAEATLLLEALAPFGVQRRNDALEMARLYAVLHALENEVRSLIRDILDEQLKANWWDTAAVPNGVKKMAESRQKIAEKDSWLEGAKSDRLEFVDFGLPEVEQHRPTVRQCNLARHRDPPRRLPSPFANPHRP